jgi:predicted dehydrogenase
MAKREIRFGLIGGGLMGKEFASAAARWCHLRDLDFEPKIVALSSITLADLEWFQCQINGLELATTDYRELLGRDDIEAIYCAVPHDLHTQIYCDIIRAGKHLLGEKPFGINHAANETVSRVAAEHPDVLVRCSSEFPFWPGPYRLAQWASEGRFGQIIEVEAGFWHSSDLDPRKPINWKRRVATCGEYGCMGDLGMHVVHLPYRLGWYPKDVRALLSKIVAERPGKDGVLTPCETWDNAILATTVETAGQAFPMLLSTKRIAPGHANTWFIRIAGTSLSAEFSTKHPKQITWMPYAPGDEQAWRVMDAPHTPPYASITGPIFEFGFSDGLLQMFAAFCDELVNGRAGMRQPLYCVTPEEAAASHALFTAALESQRESSTVPIR